MQRASLRGPVSQITSQQLRAISWFKTASEDILGQVAPFSSVAEYGDGEPIWHAGDPAEHFSFVARGLVQVVKATARGNDVTLGIFGPGEGVGNIATMEHSVYPASALAASDSVRIVRVGAALLKRVMKEHPEILARANNAFMHKARALLTKIDVLSAGPVSARLALLFLHLGERFGDEPIEGGLAIPIALSRGGLARLVSAREETVIRVLSQWKQAGWVSTTPHGFLVHMPAMLEAAISSDADADP